MTAISWSALVSTADPFLVEVAGKSSLFIAALLLADHLLGDRRASWRNLVWHAALAGLVLIPLASTLLPVLRVPVLPDVQSTVSTGTDPPQRMLAPNAADGALQTDPPPAQFSPTTADVILPQIEGLHWAEILFLIYIAGTCFFLGRLGMGLWYVASLRRQTRELEDERLWPVLQELRTRLGIRRAVHLGTSEQVGSPLQVGVFSPMAILPAQLTLSLDEQTFRAIAAHELAHVRRWDYLVHLLAMTILAFHWFNPLAWLAVRRLRQTGEHICDEWAVRLIGRYEIYARALLEVLGQLQGQRVRWGAGMAFQAEERLERILAMRNEIPARVGRGVGLAAMVTLATGAVLLGCSALAGEGSADDPAPGGPGASSSLPLFTQKVIAPFPDDFMGIPWGSSRETTRVAMLKIGGQEAIWDDEVPTDLLAFDEVPFGEDTVAQVHLSFFDNHLCGVTVMFSRNEKTVASVYERWRDYFTAKYGDAYEWSEDWTDSVAAAFRRGTHRSAEWWFPVRGREPNHINLSLSGHPSLWITIYYNEGEFSAKLRERQKSAKQKSYSWHYPPKPVR